MATLGTTRSANRPSPSRSRTRGTGPKAELLNRRVAAGAPIGASASRPREFHAGSGALAPNRVGRPAVKTGTAAHPRPKARAAAVTALPSVPGRILFLCIGTVILYVALAFRLFFLQVLQHGEFVAQAEAIREKKLPLPARRGVLLDRNGALLVRNEPAVNVDLDPNPWFIRNNAKIGDTPEARQRDAVERLDALLKDVDVAAVIRRRGIRKGRSGRYHTIEVAREISPDVAQAIEKESLSGVGLRKTTRRVAVDGKLAPHVVGFTGRDGGGLDGLEHGLEEELTGEKGVIIGEFDTRLRPIPGTVRTELPPRHGRDVVLTMDARLQHVVEVALEKSFVKYKAEAATAVVLNPKTGDILALANFPSYDVNHRRGAPLEARLNRAVTATFEPGSTLKVVTVAAALEDGKVAPDTHFYCSGSRKIGRRTISCAHGRHGDVTTLDVIRNSCNVVTAECAFQLGKRRLFEYEEAFGFGQKTEAGLPGEGRGLLSHPDEWSQVQFANIAFGQGISVTPLQLTAAYAAIANDGVWMRPRILWGERDPETQEMKEDPLSEGRRIISPDTARQVKRMLQSVVDDGTGTLARVDGYSVGGKTGTAQIAERGGYGGKFVSSFVGMAPMSDPRFVILVAVTAPKGEHYGGVVAAPVFKEIAEQALLLNRVPRDRTTNPAGLKPKTPRSLAD